jgi:hypothetical protein
VSVDVVYEGWVMARGVEAKADGEALFVPAEAALPVGTRVTLRGPDGETAYRVARVQENFTPGMILESLAPPKAKPEPVPEAVPEPTEEAGGGDDKKGKRRKRKNTLT